MAEGAKKIMGIMAQISWAIRAVALFAMASGLAVLFGIALAAGRLRRQEAALLKTLGAGRRVILQSLAAEFGILGFLSAGLGAFIALGLGWVLMVKVLELPFRIPWTELSLMALGLTLACAAAGILACLQALYVKPLEVLREE